MISHKEEKGGIWEPRESRSIFREPIVQITRELWIDHQILYKFQRFVNTRCEEKSLTNI